MTWIPVLVCAREKGRPPGPCLDLQLATEPPPCGPVGLAGHSGGVLKHVRKVTDLRMKDGRSCCQAAIQQKIMDIYEGFCVVTLQVPVLEMLY
jgi:hypothetical protein